MTSSAMNTRITSLLRCRYPILLPGMSWISTPELVAAVSNAGGVGILATGPLNSSETRDAIDLTRSLLKSPSLPFGVGVTLLMPGASDNAKVALEKEVPLINVSLGKADWIADSAHSYGGNVLATVTNAKHAGAAIEAGADALLVTGHEAAAHGGDVTSLVLIPSLAERYPEIPLVAAGGFANGRGLLAALNLGADAVAMGSRLACTAESPLAEAVKITVASDASTESHTVYGKNFDGIPARVLRTETSERLMSKPPAFPIVLYRAVRAAGRMGLPLYKVLPGLMTQWDRIYPLAQFGAATDAIMKATVHGELGSGGGVQFIGQCQGLIRDTPVVEDLLLRIVREAELTSRESQAYFQDATDGRGNR